MSSSTFFVVVAVICCLLNFQPSVTAANELSTYIVHVAVHPDNLLTWYNSSILSTNLQQLDDHGQQQQPRTVLFYRHVFPGFAAKLSESDLESLRQKKGFISASPERVYPLLTTHSPEFLGLVNKPPRGFWNISNYGKGVIIGLLDTGITPGHPSFGDEGMPPPPPKWKGECQFSACNNKLIGARSFVDEGRPTDQVGHGTHTAATAAGNFVDGANVLGSANGTASGIAPRAHLSIYQVCGSSGCTESTILAGFEAAISDGVDIISMSLGGVGPVYFHQDNLAIAAYSATQKGILVSASAGNSGPTDGSVINKAPWFLTVGASTIDRKLQVAAVLGNGEVIYGESAFQPKDFVPGAKLEIVFGSDAGPDCDGFVRDGVEGKIVVCEEGRTNSRVSTGQIVKNAGGAAMILIGRDTLGNVTFTDIHLLPALDITYADGQKLIAYLNSKKSSNHTATISFKGTVLGHDLRAPVVAGFSSRGPNPTSPGILKPDIIGPGVNILAAWYRSVEGKTGTKANYNLISGTSMSCPHLSGVAALLKSAHPKWSPAVIKSAIITTADHLNRGGNPIEDETWSPASVFATGAGHVNVSRANDPGLVYDIQPDDYIPYLCGLNYTDEQVGTIVQRVVDCSKEGSIPEAQLNYPSFSIVLAGRSTPQRYTRTVTNVGERNSSYAVKVVAPRGVNVTVKPVELKFSKLGQKLEYNVTFTGSASAGNVDSAQGSITWNSATRSVRSPIAVVFE